MPKAKDRLRMFEARMEILARDALNQSQFHQAKAEKTWRESPIYWRGVSEGILQVLNLLRK